MLGSIPIDTLLRKHLAERMYLMNTKLRPRDSNVAVVGCDASRVEEDALDWGNIEQIQVNKNEHYIMIVNEGLQTTLPNCPERESKFYLCVTKSIN